jgi:hypothetical protein
LGSLHARVSDLLFALKGGDQISNRSIPVSSRIKTTDHSIKNGVTCDPTTGESVAATYATGRIGGHETKPNRQGNAQHKRSAKTIKNIREQRHGDSSQHELKLAPTKINGWDKAQMWQQLGASRKILTSLPKNSL